MEDCSWEDRLVGTSIDVNWAIITYFLQWVSTVLVERCQQTKHLQSWWFCILNLNWFHQGCFLASDFIYGANSIRQWHQHLNKTFIFFFWQTVISGHQAQAVISWCKLNLRRSCQEQNLLGKSLSPSIRIFSVLTTRDLCKCRLSILWSGRHGLMCIETV